MIRFARLYAALDRTTSTNAKVAALVDYFTDCPPVDAAWAVYFLCGRKQKRLITTTKLREWACEAANLPDWLFAECYDTVGDLAETVALLLPEGVAQTPLGLAEWMETRLLPMNSWDDATKKAVLLQAWQETDTTERLVLNKLITGGFRVGVSQALVVRGLAQALGIDPAIVTQRLMGDWQPTASLINQLQQPDPTETSHRPYPFFLAHPLEQPPEALGDPAGWSAEWKWDGIRAQLMNRGEVVSLWTRGEELVTERYPEIERVGIGLPAGTVVDGEILPWDAEGVLAFGELQKRIGRKTVSKKLLQEIPTVFMAYDLLETGGADLRAIPFAERRRRLEVLVQDLRSDTFKLSPGLAFTSWQDLACQRESSRSLRVEGVMLKRLDSPYRQGRVRGDWWKWKIDPLTMDAVLTAAQPGHGKRAGLFTDYTFSVWNGSTLVTIAKAYSGLSDAEIRSVDAFVRANTIEKFGPVRTVHPKLVFELAFEGIQESTRHKAGLAVRFPRILRPRPDKLPEQADTLDRLRQLLAAVSS